MNCFEQLKSLNNIPTNIINHVKNAFRVSDINKSVIPILSPVIQLANNPEFIKCLQEALWSNAISPKRYKNIQHHLHGMMF